MKDYPQNFKLEYWAQKAEELGKEMSWHRHFRVDIQWEQKTIVLTTNWGEKLIIRFGASKTEKTAQIITKKIPGATFPLSSKNKLKSVIEILCHAEKRVIRNDEAEGSVVFPITNWDGNPSDFRVNLKWSYYSKLRQDPYILIVRSILPNCEISQNFSFDSAFVISDYLLEIGHPCAEYFARQLQSQKEAYDSRTTT